jgi:hypothetical protein
MNSYFDLSSMNLSRKSAREFEELICRRGATTDNSPQFQLLVAVPNTFQAPTGRSEDRERFCRPSGTRFDLAGESRS